MAGVAAARIFAGPGEMRERCRRFDWASTPLGPVTDWPAHLVVAAQVVLGAGVPMALHWGREGIQIYNDACIAILGARHPAAFGASVFETLPELKDGLAALLARVWQGETVTLVDSAFVVDDEERWFTVDLAPVRDTGGEVAGAFIVVVETTARVRADAELRDTAMRSQMIVESPESDRTSRSRRSFSVW